MEDLATIIRVIEDSGCTIFRLRENNVYYIVPGQIDLNVGYQVKLGSRNAIETKIGDERKRVMLINVMEVYPGIDKSFVYRRMNIRN